VPEGDRFQLQTQRVSATEAEENVSLSADLRANQFAQLCVLRERSPRPSVRSFELLLFLRRGGLARLAAQPVVEAAESSCDRCRRAEDRQRRGEYHDEPASSLLPRTPDDVTPVGPPVGLGGIGIELIEDLRTEFVHGRTSWSRRRSEVCAALSVAPTVPEETWSTVAIDS
jgi:hypothetical protein